MDKAEATLKCTNGLDTLRRIYKIHRRAMRHYLVSLIGYEPSHYLGKDNRVESNEVGEEVLFLSPEY